MFNLLSEGNILIDILLERIFPIPQKIGRRFLVQLVCGFVLLVLLILYFGDKTILQLPGVRLSIVFSLIFVVIMVSVFISARIFEKWMYALQEVEELKREKMKMDYTALQDQLNPHYLFNNLSVLKSLILYDRDAAVQFTQNFTDVYRYVLQSKDKMTIRLKTELDFIEAYIGLHQERLGEGLQVKFSIEKQTINRDIPPLTLQLLVENAIKHNVVSKAQPLIIEIEAKGDFLSVKNNVLLKETFYSTKTGLKNLLKRYQLLTDKKVEVEQAETYFLVKLPLL